jgi:hypothetical protein
VGFTERIGELMWPSGETGGDEPEHGPVGTAEYRPGLLAQLHELGIADEDAQVIVQRQREIDAAGCRR